jgi:hypothetical protein
VIVGFHGPCPTGAAEVRLTVEVVGPTSTTKDRVLKPTICAAAGVPHYWRVELEDSPSLDPDHKPPVVLAYVLDGSAYRLAASLSAGTRRVLPGPFEVEFDPAELASP